jgi:transposase
MTHDYQRNGATTLFAALNLLQGKVLGDCHKRHRHREFLKFLRRIDREFPGDTPLHLVIDNYGTHGTPEVKAWLNKHRRLVQHYVPTSCSWLNLMERWFAAIEQFLAAWNDQPRPFVWTATVDSILAKLARCRQTSNGSNLAAPYPRREKESPANSWTLH